MVRRPNIELHIEELVLHGFEPGERHAVGDAVRQELAGRLAENGINITGDLSIERLDAGTIEMSRTGETTGRAIGGALHSALEHGNANSNDGRTPR